MAPDTRPTCAFTDGIIFNINKCDSKTNNKMSELIRCWTLMNIKGTMLLLLFASAFFIGLADGEHYQSTFSLSTVSLTSDLHKAASPGHLLPLSSEASSELESSRPAIPSTGNSQVFSTTLLSSGSTAETSSQAPWELPGSRTDEVLSVSTSILFVTEISQIQPTLTLKSVSSVHSHSSSPSTCEENNDGGATLTNDVLEESFSKTVAHFDRFQPTISESEIKDLNGDVSSSETIRLARSIDHSATPSIGSRQLLQGKAAVTSGERLSSDEKTVPLPVVPPTVSISGEARRAPRQGHAQDAVGPIPPLLKPNPSWINASPRRSEPDIQDIITGIVKLLGGNVNVAAVPGPPPHNGRPLRPMGVRINNRGPPRITDVGYESTPSVSGNITQNTTPSSNTRQPPPYPFDRPPPPPTHQHIPFPGMENSESFMSPPPPPQETSSTPSPKPTQQRPRPQWPRPQLPNRRPLYPDVLQASETTTTEIALSSEEHTTTSTTSSTTESETTSTPATTTTESPIQEGVGVATPVQLESSIPELVSTASSSSSATPVPPAGSSASNTRPAYVARPGLVLDDPEFKPGGAGNVPIITAPIRGHLPPGHGEVFDVTVSAVQGPGGVSTGRPQIYQVPINQQLPDGADDVITRPEEGQDFVSIDGKRTYINLFPTEAGGQGGEVTAGTSPPGQRPSIPTPTAGQQKPQQGVLSGPVIGTGVAVADPSLVPRPGIAQPSKPTQAATPGRRPGFTKRPPVRIDTCIVGDASTCDEAQNEACRTEQGVSSCHCRPGFSRRKHRDPCRRVVSVMLNLRVDKVYETRAAWTSSLADAESDDYQRLEWETVRALDSAMGMTPFSDEFMGARVNGYLKPPPNKDGSASTSGILVNATLLLAETTETARPQVKQDIQRHLLGVITRRNNNVGDSALWVDKPPGAVSALQDLDECSSPELNDCNVRAQCTNIFGTFRCSCTAGLRDPWAGNVQRSGRTCEACPAEHCSNRGECTFQPSGDRLCTCTGNFYGAQCELDGEVLGVAIGATVAAVLIIGLTLLGLCMWSRRWNREQQKAEMLSTRTGITSPVFSYMAAAAAAASSAASVKSGLPPPGAPASYVSVEDRLRWAHIADVMAQNHYAVQQPEPCMPTRPSSAVFGAYPSLNGTLPHMSLTMQHMRPPPPPLQGPPSSSDDEDQRDLLGRNFHVPRPRSRAASVANQSGIYYDLDYETAARPTPIPAPRSTLPRPPQSPPPIPMATYMQQQGRFFRS